MTKPELSDADRARIAARYPSRRPVDVAVAIAAALALAVAVGIVAIAGLAQSNPPVAGLVRAFETVSPQLTTVELVVQREDPSLAATCSLFAQAYNYERVGELEVPVPPGDKELTEVFVDIQTIREAEAVELEGCRLGQ